MELLDSNLVLVCVLVSFIGGINWLVTALRIMMEDTDYKVKDLLNVLGLDHPYNSLVYVLVFMATLAVFYQHFVLVLM